MGCQNSKDDHCCPPGSWPALAVDYIPKGEMIKVENVDVYHIGSGKRVLILFEDIFGMESSRHKSVADAYANIGYNVYVPKLMVNPYAGELDFGKILANAKSQSMSEFKAKIVSLLKYLETNGHKKVFGVGFCWGIYVAVKTAGDIDNFIAFVAFHPSLHMEKVLEGGSDVELVKKCKTPIYFFPCKDDQANCKTGGELVKLVTDKFGAEKTGTYEFTEQEHGFVVRGDIKIEQVRRDVELAINLSDKYFKKFE